MLHDNTSRYGSVTRWLHWLMTLLIIQQFFKLTDRIGEGEHWLGDNFGPWHISIGALVLLLVVVRIAWVLSQLGHRPVHRGPTAPFVRLGHFALYVTMLLMPVTGICYMLGNGYGLTLFGMELAERTDIETPWLATIGSVHSPLAWLFLGMLLGHTIAALYHHWVLRDDTMKRML